MYFLKISKDSEGDRKVSLPFDRGLTTQRFAGPGVVVSVGTDETYSAVTKEGDRLVIIDSLDPDFINQIDLSGLEITAQNHHNLLGNHLFSLVFVDLSKKVVSLVRSLSSARSLYYSMTESDFYCASSIVLLKYLGCQFEPDRKALPEFYVYRTVLSPHTLVKGVNKLAAAEFVNLEYFNRSSIKSHYFDFSLASSAAPTGLDETIQQVEAILSTNIATAFQRDSHPACLLSGGLDSSLLALIARDKTDDLASYSSDFSFLNKSDRESEYATSAAEHLGIKHTVCRTNEAEYVDALIDSIAVAGEPLHHLQTVLLYILFNRCSNRAHRIFLCGLGADDFLGNSLHRELLRFGLLIRLSQLKGISLTVRTVARLIAQFDSRFDFFCHSFGKNMESDHHILWTMGRFGDVDFVTDYLSCTRSNILLSRRELMARYNGCDIMNKVVILSLLGGLSTTLPLWARLAEHAGLALIYPYITPTMADYINSVPWTVKAKADKVIVKSILEKHGIPKRFIDRPKLSFGFPVRYWALPGALFQPLIDMAERMYDRSVLRSLQVEETGKAMVLWNMINYYLWHSIFIEDKPSQDLKRELRDRRNSMV